MTDEIHELSGAYAVDALDDVERARFERHLADCPACRDEVESLSVAAAELSVTETAPPASLRAGVLSGIKLVRQLPPLTEEAGRAGTTTGTTIDTMSSPDRGADLDANPSDAGGPSEPPSDAASPVVPAAPLGDPAGDLAADDTDTGGTVTPLSRGSRRSRATQGGRSPWRGLVAAGAAAVLVIGGFSIWRSVDSNKAPQSASQQVLEAPDATKSVHDFPNGGSATIVRSASLGKAVLVGTDLPSPGPGKTYQLWLQSKDSDFTSAGLVPGDGDQVVVLGGDAATAAGAGITIEPAGGSKQPTTEPLALFPFSA
ncbi:MAG: anti-sigma factor [Humibacillus sp.]|nr:anti-sigma factor [Humibacillus sp.]MDN5778042.1 anti-sigma factor [Humibacillus sp.]